MKDCFFLYPLLQFFKINKMMKKFLPFLMPALLLSAFVQAQTWTGTVNSNWNTAGNWSTNAVPIATGTVSIPNTANKPALAGNTTIASLNMSAGSELNFNGFSLTVNGTANIAGATLSNSNGATDIVMTISAAGGGGTNYIGGSSFTDHATLSFNGSATTYEAYAAGNTYSGNSTFNLGGTGTFYSGYSQKSSFGGNHIVNRTVAGTSELFSTGVQLVNGNFSYTNSAGGSTAINGGGAASGTITGTVNVVANGAGNPAFTMRRIKNGTTGGTISVQNSGPVDVGGDTLLLAAMNISGFTGAGSDNLRDNFITGNVTFSEAGTNTGTVYTGNNTFSGTTVVGTAGINTWYEGYQQGNVYNGNTTFNLQGAGIFNSSYSQKCSFGGNLTVTKSVNAGSINLFETGFNYINGNFSFSNTAGGASSINGNGSQSGAITGTVNITANGSGNPTFYLNKLKNNTGGGTINVQNCGAVQILNDTLLFNSMTIEGFTGNSSDYFQNNLLTGNVIFSEAAANGGTVYVGNNSINGNTTLTVSSGTTWYESYQLPCVYNGNTNFTINGTGTFNSSYNAKSSFGGNLTVLRTAAGTTQLLENGFGALTGNFSYTNAAGGGSYINSNNNYNPPISGTVNINVSGPGNPPFVMYKVKNLTGGGSVSIQNSGSVSLQFDTLTILSLNATGFTGNAADELRNNLITGSVIFNEAANNGGTVYVGNNTINGNSTMSANSTTTWYECYLGSNTYNGDVTFNRTGTGAMNLSYSDTMYAHKNFTLNSTAGIDINYGVELRGEENGSIEQLGTQPITIPRFIMNKTGSAAITLNDSVTVNTAAVFTRGNVYTSTGKELIFPNNINHTGASDISHVIGPVIKTGTQAFTFPVGGPNTLNTVAMSAPVGTGSRFRASYKNQNPTSDGYNTSLKAGSFGTAAISQAGYWDVQRLTGSTNVTLTLGFNSNPYEQYSNLANLKVAHWNGAQWDDHGNGGTTGNAAAGTVVNSTPITSFSPFTIAGAISTYHYVYGTPGPGPDGTPVKFTGTGGYPPYNTRQLPSGTYSADSVYLIPNGSSAGFKLRDAYNVEKNDTSVTVVAAPTTYISANGNGTVNFRGWRHFVYLRNGSNQIIGAVRDNNLTLGNVTMTAYFSTANVATAPNGNVYGKRSFKITSQLAPVGTKRVRFYISKTEYNNLAAADPASFPNGINSLTITKYNGPQEDSLFNPIPGGNSSIIPNSDITIVDMGTMYSLDIDVTGFSGFYIGGNQSNLSVCAGSTIAIPSNVNGTTYQWQVNTGSGFTNITNNAVYGGATTKTLTLTNLPSSYYGYQYRAFVNGSSYSQVYTAKFTATWEGTANNVWENPANWSCGILPDANTDVLINAGKPNYPQLGANTSVRTVRIASGATATIKTGFNLTITK